MGVSFSPLGEREDWFPLGTLEIYRILPELFLEDGGHPSTGFFFHCRKLLRGPLPPTPELSDGFGRPWEKLGGRKAPA